MKLFTLHKILALGITFALIQYPVEAAVVGSGSALSENGAVVAGSESLSTSSEATGADAKISSTAQLPNLIMGGINFPKQPITMDFQDADIRDVLRLLALKSGLNIIYGADVTGPVSVHLDRVPFDQAFQTVLTLKSLVALSMGPKIIRVVTSTALTTEQSQAATFTRVFRLNYANADDVKRPVDAIRGASNRKGVSTVDAKTNSLIITDTQEGLKEVEDLIPLLDKKPQQVDIESKIVEVTLNKNTQLGVSWQYAGAGGPRDSYKIGSSQFQEGITSANGPAATAASDVLAPAPPGQVQTGIFGTGIDFGGVSTKSGLSFLTKQGTYLLGAQLSALQTDGKVKLLSTPHIVTTNNEEAKINVVDRIPYLVSTLSGSGVSQQSVQIIEAGVKLTVKPIVNADRRITLKVKPEVSDPTGGGSDILPPTVNSRNAETTVLLRDGETIAIGGLIRETSNKTVVGIPILMSIPILGNLFKSTSDDKRRTELIVFLTPRIAAE